MKKFEFKPIIFSALLYVVYYCGISALGFVIVPISGMIISAITYNEFIRELIPVISMITVGIAGLFILSYIGGYRKNIAHDNKKIISKFIIAVICSYIIYYLMGLFTKFAFHFNFNLTLLFYETHESLAGRLYEEHFGMLNITFFILLIPMFIASLWGFKQGVSKREKERQELVSKKQD